ncbi:glycosyltransferase family 2 protein [Cellulomonas soli]|uniref:glycosyltransferase family 2 protein n=1 Tax=Cellulomonas soli TaxID=931535 RepID=UPI0011BF6DEA|nr:glycosyltransferase family 2 protein [Cellulomonas soli]NYI59527.1 hypothetical protein [Cellulomonas soli]
MRQQAVTVSAVLIVKDEEAVLAACLASVAWADEIVVYDTGSTDRTREIARQFTDIVVEGYWDEDFAAARNRALTHATSDWVLSIDADEVLEGDPRALRNRLERGTATLCTVLVQSVPVNGSLPLALAPAADAHAVARVFRREEYRWHGALHEQPARRDGAPERTAALPDVRLHHTGYLVGVVEGKGKAERNLRLALHELDEARRQGLPAVAQEERRMHVARSTVFTGRHQDALDLGAAVADGTFLNPRHAVMLAQAMLLPAELVGDESALDHWLGVWQTHDETEWAARAARARHAARRGDAEAALDALAPTPTTAVNSLGERFSRLDSVTVEVWALATLGRARQAARVARDAAERGVAPGAPGGLVSVLGRDRVLTVIGALDDRLWREYATWCVMDASRDSRTFLECMAQARPGDATVLGSVALLTPALTLEEAAQWAVAFRAAGAAEECPLVATSLDERQDPRQRALAGALAFSAYHDTRALVGLEQALALVPEEHAAALLADLEVVAPGLVGSGSSV